MNEQTKTLRVVADVLAKQSAEASDPIRLAIRVIISEIADTMKANDPYFDTMQFAKDCTRSLA